ncbi:MAG: chemotaxis response regulator protein-glutamate methylesterase [Planctomycetes bacterium]|nr:chemotaxis response regulator protein-glutamate methylesterase [Planctomycetota bacterium]
MIRVLVVDDSAVVRKVLSDELSKAPDIEVVDTAVDPYVAREKIMRLRPDVLTLDIEMPRMDGLEFLSKLMAAHPIPVVIVSSLTPRNSEMAMKALALGAVEVLCKPGSQFSAPDVGRDVVRAVRSAAGATVRKIQTPLATQVAKKAPLTGASAYTSGQHLFAIGSSTGGPRAVEALLTALPADAPGTIIVQHMPADFTKPFAERLDSVCAMEVREASEGDFVVPGRAFVAPGGKHLLVEKSGARYVLRLKDGPPVHYQKPAVDPTFQSIARVAGPHTVATILTGMGADGARGLLALREAGARTFAEDESTCIVFGMPREALKLGAAERAVPLPQMAATMLEALERLRTRAA